MANTTNAFAYLLGVKMTNFTSGQSSGAFHSTNYKMQDDRFTHSMAEKFLRTGVERMLKTMGVRVDIGKFRVADDYFKIDTDFRSLVGSMDGKIIEIIVSYRTAENLMGGAGPEAHGARFTERSMAILIATAASNSRAPSGTVLLF